MPVILRSRRAMGDLEEIWNYIACDSDSRADRWLERIDKVFHFLAEQPGAGKSRPEWENDIRSFPVGQYLVLYKVFHDGIRIVRVLHGARQIPRLFGRG